MEPTQEMMDWATSESKSKYPGRLVTLVMTLAGDYCLYMDIDSKRVVEDTKGKIAAVATFLNGERYHVQALCRRNYRGHKGHKGSEKIDCSSFTGHEGANEVIKTDRR